MKKWNSSPRIDEDELRSALRHDAERYAVPAAGPERVLTAIEMQAGASVMPAPSVSWAQGAVGTRRTRRVTMTLVGLAAAVVLALLIGSLGDRATTHTTASESSPASVATGATGATAARTGQGALGASDAKSLAPTAPGFRAAGGASARSSKASNGTATPVDQTGTEKIVKTGSIELEVPRRMFSDRVDRLTGVTKGLGGFVAETSTSEAGTTPTGTITLRVPADRFETLLVQVRRLGKVRSATSAAQDVTKEYTDVTGRLKTMQDERDSLDLVLTDAKNVPDILAVRDRLNSVQAEIEQLEGRRKVLDDQASLATLTVSLHEPGPTAPPLPRPAQQSGLSRSWHRAVHGFTGGIESIVAGSGKVLLVALCAAGVWLIGRPVWHRFRRALV